MSFVRLMRTARTTLSRTFYVDETATDATGNVTVSVKRLDGTAVESGTATHPGPTGKYEYSPAASAVLDAWTVDWTGTIAGASTTLRDYVEICGGPLFGLAEARAELGLSLTTWPTAKIARKRIDVEDECERICGQEFVPRFYRVSMMGNDGDALVLPRINIRAIRAVSVAGTALDSAALAALRWGTSGVIRRPSGYWPANQEIVVEFESGLDYPPPFLSQACIERLQSRLSEPVSDVPPRALSYTVQSGGTYRLTLPTGETTGVPTVDAIYAKYTLDKGGFA